METLFLIIAILGLMAIALSVWSYVRFLDRLTWRGRTPNSKFPFED